LDYWLAAWVACYSALESAVETHPNILVVPYEHLCNEPRVWTALCEEIGIEAGQRREIRAVSSAPAALDDRPLCAAAEALYARYLKRGTD
jgi:hypothetical protein